MRAAPILADHRLAARLERQRSELGSRGPAVQFADNLDRRLNRLHFVGRLTVFAIVGRGELGVCDDDFGDGRRVLRCRKSATILRPLGDESLVRFATGGGTVSAEIDVPPLQPNERLARGFVATVTRE